MMDYVLHSYVTTIPSEICLTNLLKNIFTLLASTKYVDNLLHLFIYYL